MALFFGIVRPYKGLIYLIRALAHLKNRGEIFHLLIAGEFWENESVYRKHITDLGITEQIHIDNRYIPNEELGNIFSTADVFVAPYILSTQSGALRIAMGFGLPSIVSNAVNDSGLAAAPNIYFVPPFDAEAIANQLSTFSSLIRDEGLPNIIHNASPGWRELVNEIEKIARNIHTPRD